MVPSRVNAFYLTFDNSKIQEGEVVVGDGSVYSLLNGRQAIITFGTTAQNARNKNVPNKLLFAT